MTNLLRIMDELLANLPDASPHTSSERLVDIRHNHLFHMDNLHAVQHIPPASLDFVYIDPPFASNATYYRRIWLGDHTVRYPAYIDTWEDGLASYLAFLVPRLVAIRPLLKPTGSICVHVGTHSSHYLKVAMDQIYGADRLINEVIWRYGKMSNTSRRFPQNHDTLLIYAASSDWYFQPVFSQPSEYRARFARDLTGNRLLYGSVKDRCDKLIRRRIVARERDLGRPLVDADVLFDFDTERKVQDDVFTDISIIRGNAHEGTGFDTQKPLKLLERLISAYSPPGGVIADFFSGSGSTGVAAQNLGRSWVLVDQGWAGIQTTRLRVAEHDYIFHRDSSYQPQSFAIADDGHILDFAVDTLGLSTTDAMVVQHLLETDPDQLIAGQIGETTIDVFGREATRNP